MEYPGNLSGLRAHVPGPSAILYTQNYITGILRTSVVRYLESLSQIPLGVNPSSAYSTSHGTVKVVALMIHQPIRLSSLKCLAELVIAITWRHEHNHRYDIIYSICCDCISSQVVSW